MKRLAGYLVAFVTGILPGFFIVFNAVFTDSSGRLIERLITFLLVILSYIVIGAGFGYYGFSIFWKLGIALALPAILILAFYSTLEVKLIPMNILYIFLTLISSFFGTWAGMTFRNSK